MPPPSFRPRFPAAPPPGTPSAHGIESTPDLAAGCSPRTSTGRRTGRRAIDELGAEALLLDDGFQYQRLEKDIEIVLVDALLPFGYDFLVPRGLLREPPRHLARADAIWLTHSDLLRDRDLQAVRARVKELAPEAQQEMERMSGIIQEMGTAYEELKQQLDTKDLEHASKERIAAMNADSKESIARLQADLEAIKIESQEGIEAFHADIQRIRDDFAELAANDKQTAVSAQEDKRAAEAQAAVQTAASPASAQS